MSTVSILMRAAVTAYVQRCDAFTETAYFQRCDSQLVLGSTSKDPYCGWESPNAYGTQYV